ncbi:MAG TPA: YrdB family protein [Spirochaetia bacterium]|nr:YrdB family protein [Spirochaetia bacterium]
MSGGRLLSSMNDLIAFLVELAALGALCYWGISAGGTVVAKLTLGIGSPLAMAVVWGLLAAPRARFQLPRLWLFALKVLIFGITSAALYAAGRSTMAILFAVIALINTVTVTLLRVPQAPRHDGR